VEEGAIQLIQDTAVKAELPQRLNTDTPALFYQGNIINLEKLQANRSRFRGAFKTASMQDFMAYVVARDSGQGFIDTDSMSAKVFFNLMQGANGTASTPGHADHFALLQLKRTAAYAAMRHATETKLSQRDVVNFIEDWPDCIAADFEGASAPESDPKLLTKAITAVRKVTVKAKSETTSDVRNTGASRSSMEEIEASSADGLPNGFRFDCVPFEGLPGYTFYLRLSVLTSDDKPMFNLRWRSRDEQIEQIGQDFKTKLLEGIADKATMLLGAFDPGA
jgi:uncharacterized protein YfdQ (DUF2303 family)